MRSSRASTLNSPDLVRSLPIMLVALSIVVGAVDLLLALQPVLLDEWSHGFQRVVTAHPMLAPAADVLAAALAAALIVIASAVGIAYASAVRAAPQLTVAPVWIAVCMLSAAPIQAPFALPLGTSVFMSASALLFVGAASLLRASGRTSDVLGWVLLATPLLVFGVSYVYGTSQSGRYSSDVLLLSAALVLSAGGAVASAFARPRPPSEPDIPGLEGIDVVAELSTQVERAERSEARVAELERLLGLHNAPPAAPAPQAPQARPKIRVRGPTLRLR
ncbi:MAG: hypothetical protein ABW321_23885 [Polyangiales bacterium]